MLRPSLPTFKTIGLPAEKNMNSFGDRGELSDVVASQKGYVRRIKQAGLRGRWRDVGHLLAEMRSRGVPRNLFTYNAAISALGRCGRAADAETLLNVMMDLDGLEPDAFSFNTSISAHARRGDIEACRRVLERMRDNGVRPDQYTFNTIADSAAKRGDPTAAANVLAVMAEEGITPDLITYNSCLAACGRKGDLRKARTLLELMREDGLAPDRRSYSAVITAAGRCDVSIVGRPPNDKRLQLGNIGVGNMLSAGTENSLAPGRSQGLTSHSAALR